MFNISFSEILLILVIALLVFGPNQLPQIAKTAGRLLFNLRNYFSQIKQDVYEQSGINNLTDTKQDLADIYAQIKNDLATINALNNNLSLPYHSPTEYWEELDFEHPPELSDNMLFDHRENNTIH
ncbi:MAG: sec-independent protein translocase protein TatB [Pseudomonadota bacterium]|nr:sec-independent protein translocase protein TatB [Pseudomonadota bacterium]